MMYSAYKLNKQGDNIQPWHTPFPIWSQSVVPCPVLTVASWPAYRFLKRQVRYSGFIGRTDAKAEASILWPPHVKNWLIGKDPDAGKDWGQEKWVTGDEVVGWHHWLNVHEFEQIPGDSKGQGSLMCYSPWVHKELDMTEQLNNRSKMIVLYTHTHTHTFFFRFISHIECYRVLIWVP